MEKNDAIGANLTNTKSGNDSQKGPLGLDLPNSEEELFLLHDYPLLDMQLGLANLGDRSLLSEILDMMVRQELPIELKKLHFAYAKSDWDKVEELAHKLKSSALYCGTVRLKIACQYLERYRKAGYSLLLEQLYFQLVEIAQKTQNSIIEAKARPPLS